MELLLWSGRYGEALRTLAKAVKLRARFSYCWYGGALVKRGRFSEALPWLGRALEWAPHDAEARTWKAEALWRLGRRQEALGELNLAQERYHRYSGLHGHVLRGIIRREMGDAEGMRFDYNKVPGYVTDFARFKLGGLWPDAEETTEYIETALNWILRWSGGVRRGAYENAVWMR